MTTTPTIAEHQTAKPRLEDKGYKLRGTRKLEVDNYTFIVNSYQAVFTKPTVQERLIPIITRRINHILAKQNTPCYLPPRRHHAATVQEGGDKNEHQNKQGSSAISETFER